MPVNLCSLLPANNDEYQVKLHASFSEKEKKDSLFILRQYSKLKVVKVRDT